MIYILLVSLLFFCCVSTRTPVWVKEFGTKTFSKDGIEGIGFAKFDKKDKSTLIHARETAYKEAIKNLSIKLKTEIKGTIQRHLQDKITQIDKKYEIQSLDQIEILTNVTFDAVLGRKYFEEFIDYKNSLYWVYVWTTKSELQRMILEEIAKQESKNNEIMKISLQQLKVVDEYIYSGKIILAIKLLQQILSQCEEIKGIAFLEDKDNISLRGDVEIKLKKIFSSLVMIPISSTTIETFKEQPIDIDIIVRFILKYEGYEIPVVLFPLTAKFLKGFGDIENKIYTDTNGVARFKIYKLKSKENLIEISPDLDELNRQILDLDVFSQLKIVYTVIAKSIRETKKIGVKVKNGDFSAVSFLRNEIISQLKSANFNISDDFYDFIIEIFFELEYIGDKITLPNGTQTQFAEIYSGSIFFELKSTKDNNLILSKTFSDIKGFGKTKKESQLSTLKKLSELVANYIIENF